MIPRTVRKVLGGDGPEIAFRVGWGLFFAVVWSRAISTNADGGLDAGHVNVWGDWAIHFTMGSAMAYRNLILTANPLLIGYPFNYPYFVNMVSAILIRAGVSFFPAFTIPSFLYSLFLVWALPRFFSRLLGSARSGLLASLIFLLNGGLGFVKFAQDIVLSKTPLHTLTHPPFVYSNLPAYSIYWVNVVESMVIPQRAFQLGFPWMIAVLTAVMKERGFSFGDVKPEPGCWSTPRAAAALGALYGFLPIVHTHAFACGGLILISLFVWEALRSRTEPRPWFVWWGAFFLGAVAVAIPILAGFFRGALHQSVMRWRPGWYAGTFRTWLWFWWINWGPALAAAAAGFWVLQIRLRGRRMDLFVFTLPFALLFALANLFIVHSWIWDNTKYVIWTALSVAAFSAVAIQWMWSASGRLAVLLRPVAVLSLVAVCLTGAIDNYRILIPSLNTNQIYSNEDLFLADWAKKNTPVRSIWLTGDSHNHWLYNLTGRQPVETYIGWLWTHGYPYNSVDHDVEEMYRHPDRDDLFRKYGINYIVVGRSEQDSLTVDRQGLDRRFPVAMRTDNTIIYRYVKDRNAAEPAPPAVPQPALPLTASLRPGLVRRTYRGTYFFGKPLIKEGDSDINFQYGPDDPKPFPVPGSVEWEGYLRVPVRGEYRFSLESDDGAWLALDGVDVIDNGGSHPAQGASATIILAEGYHRFRLRYFDSGGSASLKFGWTSGGGAADGSEGLFY